MSKNKFLKSLGYLKEKRKKKKIIKNEVKDIRHKNECLSWGFK